LYSIQNRRLVERLLDEIDRPCLHGFNRKRNVAVAGNNDGGKRAGFRSELVQQLDAAHVRHANVGDKTPILDRGETGKKRAR
jgi:hypothetical protein